MNEEEFKRRTKQFALGVFRLVEALPNNSIGYVIGKQLIRSATSVGTNYSWACRGRSIADVIAKFSLVEKEADESLYWMEIIIEAKLLPAQKLSDLMMETNEIIAMTVASIRTLNNKSAAVNVKSHKLSN